MTEGHPGLLESLQINNNKQVLPIRNHETAHKNLTNILNSTDAERYFTVETARGYIVINREYEYAYLYNDFLSIYMFVYSFKDQIEGAQLLAFIARINSWPAAIFTELKYKNNYLENNVYLCTSFFFLSKKVLINVH
jgi:hypothetical protein